MLALAVDAMLSFSRLPLRVSFVLGLLAVVLGLGYGAVALVQALSGTAGGGSQALLVGLYLIGGCILCSLGVVGEYVGRIYEQVKARPLYLLKETSESVAAPAALDGRAPKRYPGDATAA
jgi:hypothetical protein